MPQISKTDLVDFVAATNDLTKKVAEEVVSGLFGRIRSALESGDEISIHGFGKFSVKDRAARTIRPFGGKEQTVPASKGVKFKSSKTLEDALN